MRLRKALPRSKLLGPMIEKIHTFLTSRTLFTVRVNFFPIFTINDSPKAPKNSDCISCAIIKCQRRMTCLRIEECGAFGILPRQERSSYCFVTILWHLANFDLFNNVLHNNLARGLQDQTLRIDPNYLESTIQLNVSIEL